MTQASTVTTTKTTTTVASTNALLRLFHWDLLRQSHSPDVRSSKINFRVQCCSKAFVEMSNSKLSAKVSSTNVCVCEIDRCKFICANASLSLLVTQSPSVLGVHRLIIVPADVWPYCLFDEIWLCAFSVFCRQGFLSLAAAAAAHVIPLLSACNGGNSSKSNGDCNHIIRRSTL